MTSAADETPSIRDDWRDGEGANDIPATKIAVVTAAQQATTARRRLMRIRPTLSDAVEGGAFDQELLWLETVQVREHVQRPTAHLVVDPGDVLADHA